MTPDIMKGQTDLLINKRIREIKLVLDRETLKNRETIQEKECVKERGYKEADRKKNC